MITEATIHWVTQDLNGFATRSDTGEQIYIPVPICMAAGITPDSIGDDIEVKVVRNAASHHEDKTPWRAVRVSMIDRGETPAPEPEPRSGRSLTYLTEEEVMAYFREHRGEILIAQDLVDDLRPGVQLRSMNVCQFSARTHYMLYALHTQGRIGRVEFYRTRDQERPSPRAYCYDISQFFNGADHAV
jgi:hypothetical protein